jgi:hypothetical protein
MICIEPHLAGDAVQPGLFGESSRLELADLVGVGQGKAGFVETAHEALLAEWRDIELVFVALGIPHDLCFEIDGQSIAIGGFRLPDQVIDLALGQDDRSRPFLRQLL